MVVPVLVARSEDGLDEEVFNAPPRPLDGPAPAARVPEPATA